PTSRRAAAATAAAAKPAESATAAATEPATKSAEATAKSTAESADAAVPSAPPGSPRSAKTRWAAASEDPAEDQNHDHDDEQDAGDARPFRRAFRYGRDIRQRDAASLGDALNHARRAGEQARSVALLTKGREHQLPNRLAREAVRDELLEVVSHLDAHAAVLDRQHDQRAVVLALLPDARVL